MGQLQGEQGCIAEAFEGGRIEGGVILDMENSMGLMLKVGAKESLHKEIKCLDC